MIPNMKFYVTSIVAVFIALGIGIYIGFSMDTVGIVTDHQEKLVEILEGQFEDLSKENNILKRENDEKVNILEVGNRYIEESFPYISNNKLSGFSIALIETSPNYTTSSLGYELERAGADVKNLTTLKKLETSEVERLVESIIDGDGGSEVERLDDLNKIDSLGNYDAPINAIILSSGFKNLNEATYRNIISIAKNKGVKVIGVEKSNIEKSFVSKYRESDITSIDNIETKIGKISLILSLKSDSGSYGIKGTAESILPKFIKE